MDLIGAIRSLARHAVSLRQDAWSEQLDEAVCRSLFDSLAVGLAGAQTPEIRSLLSTWPVPVGKSRVWGTLATADVATATLLNGTSLCSLELDEGNKYARGHPGAHILPAALAEAQRLDCRPSKLLQAYLAAYEIATRFARAFQPAAGLHPHGHWGGIGAAVAVALLNDANEDQVAQAIDGAAGLMLAAPFASALAGSYVRNMWVGTAGSNGVAAARIAMAGLGSVDGTARETLGRLIGTLDASKLVDELGERFDIVGGYYKRHSACGYTHPPADAALQLFTQGVRLKDVVSVSVQTHQLAAQLDDPSPRTRLGGMFSIPHVVAVALRDGKVAPAGFDAEALHDPELGRARRVITVARSEFFDKRLPAERGARVEVVLADGRILDAEVPNPIGDADYQPFSFEDLVNKGVTLIGNRAHELARVVQSLPDADTLAYLDSCLTPQAAEGVELHEDQVDCAHSGVVR